jgi:hypothetical protein
MLETPTQNRTFHALDWHANLVERASMALAHFISTTADDRRSWSPPAENDCKVRNCFQLASECITINRRTAALLRGEAPPEEVVVNDVETCTRELEESGKEFAAAIRAQDDSLFSKTFQMPFGPITGTVLLEITLGNLSYHQGQVNLIQILGGDPEFHIPPNFLTYVVDTKA